jgi:predicted DNA-binding ribbon-helix-helix protein
LRDLGSYQRTDHHQTGALEEEKGSEIHCCETLYSAAGHKTSISLEDAFWDGLKDIAKDQRKTLSDLVGSIDTNR